MADEPSGAALASYYDLDLLDDPGDVDMYLAFAAAGDGRILELCAGSGRICMPLAAAGHRVTAVDRDPHMLDRARAAWAQHGPAGGGSLDLLELDITELELAERFDLVILALNSLLLLNDRAAQAAALRVMARHLAPGGRAVIDCWLPAPDDLALYDGRAVLEWVRRDEERGEWVAKTASARYQSATATGEVTTLFDAWRDGEPVRRLMRRDTIRFIGAGELLTMVERAGLAAETTAGDYELGALAGDSERLVVVCRAAGRSGTG